MRGQGVAYHKVLEHAPLWSDLLCYLSLLPFFNNYSLNVDQPQTQTLNTKDICPFIYL